MWAQSYIHSCLHNYCEWGDCHMILVPCSSRGIYSTRLPVSMGAVLVSGVFNREVWYGVSMLLASKSWQDNWGIVWLYWYFTKVWWCLYSENALCIIRGVFEKFEILKFLYFHWLSNQWKYRLRENIDLWDRNYEVVSHFNLLWEWQYLKLGKFYSSSINFTIFDVY